MNQSRALLNSERFRSVKAQLLATILDSSSRVRGIQCVQDSQARDLYKKQIDEFVRERGRELYFPFLSSGLGSGPFVELVDGSVKYDMITGIGINFFGHTHPELISEMIDGLGSDPMQGNLEPGIEAKELIHTVLAHVGQDCRLTHGWLMCSGTMCNEIALKIIRQKKAPATKILAFRDCFAGRSTAMQEITDNAKYREGQPVYGEVEYLPFYDPELGLQASTQATLKSLREHLARQPGKFAAIMIELIQGEGGFNYAPRDFYVNVFEEAKKVGLAIWVDEIQTFGRSGELFAYQKFNLNSYVDVVTIGKMLQACMVLFSDEYNPKPGLVAGTFSGSAAALRTGRRTVELLREQNFLGTGGRIEQLSNRFREKLLALSTGSCKGVISEIRTIGGMIAFQPFSGMIDEVKAVLLELFDLGVIAFYCGHGPILVRMLPPLGAMTEAEVDQVCGLIEEAVLNVQKKANKTA